MLSRKSTKTTLIVILCAVIFSAFQYYQNHPTDKHTIFQQKEKTLEFFSTNTSTKQYRQDGSLHYEFASAQLQHFTSPKITEISKPDINVYPKNGGSWHSYSDSAQATNKNQKIHMLGNVTFEQAQQQITIHSAAMVIYPEQEYAETELPVTINSPTGTTQATGLKIDMSQHTLQLLSKVKSTYAPAP